MVQELAGTLPQVRATRAACKLHAASPASLSQACAHCAGHEYDPQNPHKNHVVGTAVFPVRARWIPGSYCNGQLA